MELTTPPCLAPGARRVQNATLRDADRKPSHRPTVDGTIDIVSPAHGRFVGAEDEVLAALAEDLPDLVTACQFSG